MLGVKGQRSEVNYVMLGQNEHFFGISSKNFEKESVMFKCRCHMMWSEKQNELKHSYQAGGHKSKVRGQCG